MMNPNPYGKHPNINSLEVHNFDKGWQKDMDNNTTEGQVFDDGWNGRLYSDNGTFFCSVAGTEKVYTNTDIIKYLGWYAFKDELICFGKCLKTLSNIETEDKIITEIFVKDFTLTAGQNDTNIIGIDFSQNITTTETTIQVPVVSIDNNEFVQNISNVVDSNSIDNTYNGLFKSVPYLLEGNPVPCSIGVDIPINNVDYKDFIISFTIGNDSNLIADFKYIGYLNFPMNSKIATHGVSENTFYKRVYFTDYYNYSRVVNLKDSKLKTRSSYEFDLQTKGMLLNPRIIKINENGQIKAGTIFYVMRLITENGQVSDYSPLSEPVKIVKTTGDNVFAGGGISQITNKSVMIDCYIPDYKYFKQVQLVAIEFQAKDVPTTLSLIGTKSVSQIVSFEHFGSEAEFADLITLSDIFANSLSWKYSSDFDSKNNKLIAVGLRNDPTYVNSKNIALDFSLSGFKPNGETHNCLLNPDPVHYNYINANMTESFMYVKRKLFRKIEIFGNFSMKLINITNPTYFYQFNQNDVIYNYENYTSNILSFLLEKQNHDINFPVWFPNLIISESEGKILFSPIDDTIQTEFKYYDLQFSTNQVIIDMDNDINYKTPSWPTSDTDKELSLVYGGVSNGWFEGNGVKVTMHTVDELVCTSNTDWMSGSTPPLKLKEPSLKKGVMKGEIYRLGIQWYKNGNRLFVTVLGDIKIPDIGEVIRELNENGQVINTSDTYKNWIVVNNEMFAKRIELQFDVRINCKLSQEVDSYQIVYVERSENNRTILSQGISAPLERIIPFEITGDVNIGMDEKVTNKWNLPSNGGPVWDSEGLKIFDIDPDNVNLDLGSYRANDFPARVITNRRSFYFDSPDMIYSKISSSLLESTKIEYIETVATDHERYNIIGGYDLDSSGKPGTEVYSPDNSSNGADDAFCGFGIPKFSQKIPHRFLAGTGEAKPNNVNVSVFANRLRKRTYGFFQQGISDIYKYEIEKGHDAKEGEVLSGYKMNETFDISNNALSLASHGWYFSIEARTKNQNAGRTTLFTVNNISSGRNTVFIKTKVNYFTDSNIAQTPFNVKTQVNFGTGRWSRDTVNGNDAYIVSNLKRKNEDSVYGGRTEFAYSSNEYIPLSVVMPIINNRIASQLFYVEGDTYCNLYLRNKTNYNGSSVPENREFQWSTHANHHDAKYQYNKYNAWCYGVVLESTVEPRLNNSEEFYTFSKAIGFSYDEIYNSGYLQENNVRKSLPKPYNFKDDPILNNIVAVSNPKLNGDFIDSWTQFLTNEFYELDKDKGTVFNIIRQEDNVIVLQELQSSMLLIDERALITPDGSGKAIQIKQGSGNSISGHKPISQYGTSYRRAIVKSQFGFIFFDERKSDFVKITESLFLKNNLIQAMKRMFEELIIVDVDGYYDEEFKESNIRFRTKQGLNFVISYNEILGCFNGRYEYDNDLYMPYQNRVFTPYAGSSKLARLNTGEVLNFFEQEKTMRIRVYSAPVFESVKINKSIAININTNFPIIKAIFETSLGHLRTVMGTHHWYKIDEGIHSIPAKNPTDYGDIRGQWSTIEIEVASKDKKQINIYSIINYFRKSYT